MKNCTFTSLDDLNTAMSMSLKKFNYTKMAFRPYSSQSLFEDVEDYLRPLLVNRFIMKERKAVTVMNKSYVTLKRHHYSVPVKYVGKSVELVCDADVVDIYYGLLRIVVMTRHTDILKSSRTIFLDVTADTSRIWIKSTNEYDPLITFC